MKITVVAHSRAPLLVATVVGAMMLGAYPAQAQQKSPISYQVSAGNSKYTDKHEIDVGDVPGHRMRVFQLHRTFPKDTAAFSGVPVKEQTTTGEAELPDGPVVAYVVYTLANGDKIFGRYEGTGQYAGDRLTVVGNTILTGGTGKFKTLRGLLHNSTIVQPSKDINETKAEGTYWMQE
ncbi:hypothetical protein PI86_07615 [Burkholderia sp. A9]|uniref:hypothetical protein n=1 Tax=Burkholderia sp. A9 TaxID=1365108 RepID=UPI0005734B02|nr:hypothetical protein [Burkholderia sp. A9]KHK59677.1 hypothetical protein PI86_07615 [Burkholderia sp. A9]